MTEVLLALIKTLSEKLQAMDLKLDSLKETQNSANGAKQILSNDLKVEMTVINRKYLT